MPWYRMIDFAAAWAFVCSADFAGMLFGVSGTLLLATKGRWAGWGFSAYLASNVGWMVFAYDHGITKLFVQHAFFSASSLVGIWIWQIKDPLAACLDRLFADPYDTLSMEDDIWHRFTGRNARQLAAQYGIEPAEVFDIVISREPTSTKAMAARYNRHGRKALERC